MLSETTDLLHISIILQDMIFSSLFFHESLKGLTIKEKGTRQGKEAFTPSFQEPNTVNYSNLLFFQVTLKIGKFSLSEENQWPSPPNPPPPYCAVRLK